LERTPSTTGTGGSKTWTYSIWLKRGLLATRQSLVDGYASSAGHVLEFQSSDNLEFYAWGGAATLDLVTTQVFRDPSAWYHIVLAVDTTQATAANRIKLYINGAQVTSFSTATYPAQNALTYIGSNVLQDIGRRGSNQFYSDCYLAEVNFIDGQALTPSSFGSTNALTGVWQPAKYTGTYGTNGFYLPFTDNSALTTSSNVGLGKDFSGNGNYWTTNNISITAGVTYDSMTDVPTLTSATAANFAVLNPLDYSSSGTITIANGNLQTSGSGSAYGFYRATMQMAVKTYWEQINTMANSGDGIYAGVGLPTGTISGSICYYTGGGQIYLNGSLNTTVASYTTGDVIGMAYDPATGNITFYKNNTSQATIATGYGSNAFPIVGDGSSNSETCNVNFGQQPFTYTPPTGFVALNTYNLPTSTIVKGNSVMDVNLWTGNSTGSTTQTITNAGGFKPDFVWTKSRSAAYDHNLVDSVRGASKILYSDLTNAEVTNANGLASFNSNGFTLGTDAGGFNDSGKTYVGWQWQAGQGSTSSNTNGTITSTVSVNASAGFSVVTYTGTGANATIGHGLGVAPQFIIVKMRSGVQDWIVYHQSIGNTGALFLQSTSAVATNILYWNNTSPTSSVVSLGSGNGVNSSTNTYVAYCWAPIAGFSAMGSYLGNGSTSGPFVYCGFQPKFILIKSTTAARDWIIWDTARNTFNIGTAGVLFPDTSGAEYSGSGAYSVAVTSNGFYLPVATTNLNASGETHIYAAFASNPFKNSLAF
jgi:hypothetical protein